jgi:2-iminobutanoate/2-iminopropanoate deaminase
MFRQAVRMVSIIALTSLVGWAGVAAALQKEVIATKNAPEAIGPYSQAIKYGDLLFVSGQIAIDPNTNQLMQDGSVEDQTRLVLNNLGAVLAANGMTMDNVLATTVFLKDLNDFAKMNAVYTEFFKDALPARTTVEVARLPRDVKIEIALIAGK